MKASVNGHWKGYQCGIIAGVYFRELRVGSF